MRVAGGICVAQATASAGRGWGQVGRSRGAAAGASCSQSQQNAVLGPVQTFAGQHHPGMHWSRMHARGGAMGQHCHRQITADELGNAWMQAHPQSVSGIILGKGVACHASSGTHELGTLCVL